MDWSAPLGPPWGMGREGSNMTCFQYDSSFHRLKGRTPCEGGKNYSEGKTTPSEEVLRKEQPLTACSVTSKSYSFLFALMTVLFLLVPGTNWSAIGNPFFFL